MLSLKNSGCFLFIAIFAAKLFCANHEGYLIVKNEVVSAIINEDINQLNRWIEAIKINDPLLLNGILNEALVEASPYLNPNTIYFMINYKNLIHHSAIKHMMFSFIITNNLSSLRAIVEAIKGSNQSLLKGALIDAAFYSKLNIISYLLENGCDPNEQDQYGNTALHLALLRKIENLVPILKRFSFDYNAKNNFGLSVFDYAQITEHNDGISFISEKGGIGSFDEDFLSLIRFAENHDFDNLMGRYYGCVKAFGDHHLPPSVANYIFSSLLRVKVRLAAQGLRSILLDNFMNHFKEYETIHDELIFHYDELNNLSIF